MTYADRWTDKELLALEKNISSIYSEAQKDFEKQSKEYFAKFAEEDEKKRKKVESGELSKNEYTQWRMAQMGRGERLDHMARQMAERATKANEVAVAYVNDKTPGIYSLNRNHEAYEIEKLGHEMVGVDYSLYNEQAVRRIVVEDPDIMPYYPKERAVNRGIDLDYGQKYIKRHITAGIIQGKSVYKIADDLQRDVTNMNRASAIRTARTAMTAAQNGGRQATMDSAKKMGIKLRKRWVATKDGRTRDIHGKADGQTVETDKPFIVGGEELMFPGDSTSASGWNLYNCRCGMRTVEKEGIEAEPRQVRIQNPAWTDAYDAETKAKAKYERALEKEKAETDPEKKKELRKKRLEKQHEYESLQQKRREIPKNRVVNGEMTYSEWAKLRGVSSGKKLTSSKTSGKLYRGLERKSKNTGAFFEMKVPIKKNEVFKICNKYGVDTSDLVIKVQYDDDYIGLPLTGDADPKRIGRIDLFPAAFSSEEELVRTVIHEKCHVMQFKKYGTDYVESNRHYMELQASYYEKMTYNYLKKRLK